MIFSLFIKFVQPIQPTPLTFSSPAKMFFSPAQEAGFSVKNILGGEEKVSEANLFFSEENVRRGPAPSGTSPESICIFLILLNKKS